MSVDSSLTAADVLSLGGLASAPPSWLDGLADGCLLADRHLTILYANAAYAAELQQSSATLVGRLLPLVIEGGIDAAACRVALAALQSGRTQETDERVGSRCFHVRARAVPDGVVLLRSDVTARRQLEEDLLQTALEYRLVLEQLPGLLWTLDTDLRFTRYTGGGLAAPGLETKEVVGLTLYEYLRTADPEFLTIRMHRRALTGVRIRYDDLHGGRHYDVTLEPLRDSAGRITGVIGLAHDVTELYRAADERSALLEQLAQARKKESLGLLAAGAAHDFNNVLSAIVGSAELLLRELPADGVAYQSAAVIKKAADRAADLTRQMLVYAGKSLPARRPLDLNALVRDNLPLLTAACPGKIALETRLGDGMPAVLADPGQIQQVVINLLVNAAEATASTDGAVTLSTGTSAGNGAAAVFLEVADAGCGISPEVQSRVFDPFFTTKGRGRGLGLSAAQGIVRAHGGQILLTSEPGRGSTFRVVLPAAEGTSHVVPCAPPDDRKSAPPHQR